MASFGERMAGAMKLEVRTFEEVEADTTATGQAIGVVVIAAFASGIGNLYWGGITGLVTGVIFALVGVAVWAVLTFVIGTKVMPEPQTKADFQQLVRTIGFANSPGVFNVLGIIPFLGWIIRFAVGVWVLIAMVIAVRQALDYTSTGRAVVVCLIGFVAYLVIMFVLAAPLALVR
ncbi:MAG: YIP1 family protein [Acidobacteria bacterium]|nr:YIP1 family protein [Acidobacteriota bacterium]